MVDRENNNWAKYFYDADYSKNENEPAEFARKHGIEIQISTLPKRRRKGIALKGSRVLPEECWMNNDNELAKWYREKEKPLKKASKR